MTAEEGRDLEDLLCLSSSEALFHPRHGPASHSASTNSALMGQGSPVSPVSGCDVLQVAPRGTSNAAASESPGCGGVGVPRPG